MTAVRNTYATAIRVTLLVALGSVLALCLLVGLRAIGIYPWVGLAAGGPLLLASVIALPIWWWTGRTEQRQLQELLDGKFIVHWIYTREGCRRFADLAWQQTIARAPALMLSALGAMVLSGGAASWYEDDLTLVNGLLFGAALGVAMAILVGIVHCVLGWLARRACLNGPADAYISLGGVYQHGRFTSWRVPWLTLEKVELEPGEPGVLNFEIKGSRGGAMELRVAVPAGKELEARQVVNHFPLQRVAARKRNGRGRQIKR